MERMYRFKVWMMTVGGPSSGSESWMPRNPGLLIVIDNG